jgi:dTDP-4-dehydrorhamnose 3,5-epimerase
METVKRSRLVSVEKTKLPNVLLFKREVFEDHRGTYEELWNEEVYQAEIERLIGFKMRFMEDDIAISNKHVLRGLHGDDRTWKLVTCLKGRFYIVVACNDSNSSYYTDWQSFVLSDSNKHQLLVPPMHGHGYVVMSDDAIFHYKQSHSYRGMVQQFTIKYDDERFGFWWPVQNPILSLRDTRGKV